MSKTSLPVETRKTNLRETNACFPCCLFEVVFHNESRDVFDFNLTYAKYIFDSLATHICVYLADSRVKIKIGSRFKGRRLYGENSELFMTSNGIGFSIYVPVMLTFCR